MSIVLRVFDPPMCCGTGVCGPSVDPDLARFAADLDWLRKQGVTVERYNLAQQPGDFVAHGAVADALTARGNAALPMILVDERAAVEGSYPSRETLAALAGVVVRKLDIAPATSGCCGGAGGDTKSTSDTKGATKTGCC